MDQRLLKLLQSPISAIAAMLIASGGLILAASNLKDNERTPETKTVSAVGTLSDISTSTSTVTSSAASSSVTKETITTTSSTSSATTTTTTTTTSSTTSTTTTTEPPAEPETEQPAEDVPHSSGPVMPEVYTGVSPNSSYYQERLAVAGDSIAYGYNVYGYIPYEHNLAQESVSMWNLNYFSFNGLGLVDAVAQMRPSLLLMSLGMNDVNMNSPETFASTYTGVIYQILERCPEISIVVSGITPVADGIAYTTNDTIRSYNSALENAVAAMNDDRVYYFDAYSVLADGSTLALRSDCSSGDGIHISSASYSEMLTAMFSYLDSTPVLDRIRAAEGQPAEEEPQQQTEEIANVQ